MKEVSQAVSRISGRMGKHGYFFLCQAAEAVLRRMPEEPFTMKEVCEELGLRYRKQPKTVSKALSRSVKDIWEYGARDELEALFGHALVEKPSPKDLLTVLGHALWCRAS